ncbi:hypothetical protein AB0H73_37155 [Streptomyces olivoreticuli]
MGARLHRCPQCTGFQYSGAPDCTECRYLVDGIIETQWARFLQAWDPDGAQDRREERELAAMVADEPDRHDWRIVDAALDRLECPRCHNPLGRGPVGCGPCDQADGFRYAAIETDRPDVTWGNEHAIRVNVAVVRRPHAVSAPELLGRRMVLPALLIGYMSTTAQAQRLGALVRALPPEGAVAELERLVETFAARL